MAQLDFYTFFRELLRQISFLYFPDRGVRPQPTFIIVVGVAITVGVGVTVIDGSLHLSY